jgi:hypothetical protein
VTAHGERITRALLHAGESRFESDEYLVRIVARPEGELGRVRVLVSGPSGVPEPTVFYDRWSPVSRRQWRAYRRALVASYRHHADRAVRELVGVDLGHLTLRRRTAGPFLQSEIRSHYDIFVLIKRRKR